MPTVRKWTIDVELDDCCKSSRDGARVMQVRAHRWCSSVECRQSGFDHMVIGRHRRAMMGPAGLDDSESFWQPATPDSVLAPDIVGRSRRTQLHAIDSGTRTGPENSAGLRFRVRVDFGLGPT